MTGFLYLLTRKLEIWLIWMMDKLNFLVGYPRRTVIRVYYTAAAEAGPLEYCLHYGIVGMGVGPQVMYLFPAPAYAGIGHTLGQTRGCKTVDCAVRAACKPSAVLDQAVCRVIPCNEAECAGDVSVRIFAYQASGSRYFGKDEFTGRIPACPLARIPVSGHELPGTGIYLHQCVYIFRYRIPYAEFPAAVCFIHC